MSGVEGVGIQVDLAQGGHEGGEDDGADLGVERVVGDVDVARSPVHPSRQP